MEIAFEWILKNIDKQYIVAIALGMIGMLVVTMILYMTRIKDHMREEKRIDDFHFSKVKEHLSDSIEHIEENILQRGLALIEQYVPEPLEGCSVSRGIDCLFMQKERFENDTNKAVEIRLKNKVIGWMRENGFHESDENGVENYIVMRKKHALDFLLPFIEKKSRVRFKSLSGKVGLLVDESEISAFLRDVVLFSIEEQKLANEEIKQYRISHGFMPEFILKFVVVLKGLKK